MINRLMEKRNREEGFTLIEMLIVVIILGILAAVVVFGVSTFRDDSVEKACETDVQSVETAAEAYRTKEGLYPVGTDSDERLAELETKKYLKDTPANNEYTITLNANGDATSNLAACNS